MGEDHLAGRRNPGDDYAGKGSHPIEFTFRYRSVDEADTEARMITEKASFIGE